MMASNLPEKIELHQSIPYRLGGGAVIGGSSYLDDQGSLEVRLAIQDGEIGLRNSIQVNDNLGNFSAFNAVRLPDSTEEVYLSLSTDETRQYTLSPGDTFPVRDQNWKLDRVENSGTPNWYVVLRRI